MSTPKAGDRFWLIVGSPVRGPSAIGPWRGEIIETIGSKQFGVARINGPTAGGRKICFTHALVDDLYETQREATYAYLEALEDRIKKAEEGLESLRQDFKCWQNAYDMMVPDGTPADSPLLD